MKKSMPMPDGSVWVYDTDSVSVADVEAARAEARAKHKEQLYPPATPESAAEARRQTGKSLGMVAREYAPDLAGMAATTLIPGGWFVRSATGVPALLRMGAAGLAGAGAAGAVGQDPMAEGSKQLGAQALGEGVLGLGRGLGRGFLRSGIGVPAEVAKDFPGVWGTAEAEKLGLANPQPRSFGPERAGVGEKVLGNWGEFTGAREVSVRLAKADENVMRALEAASKPRQVRGPGGRMVSAQPKITAKEVVAEVKKRMFPKIGRRPTGIDERLEDFVELANDMARNHPDALDVIQAHEMKRGAQEAAAPLLDSASRPVLSDARAIARANMEQEFNREVQAVLNKWLGENVRGYRALEDHAHGLIGLKRAFQYREAAPHGIGNPRVGESNVYANPLELMSPQARTTLGRSMLHPLALWGEMQAPRGVQAWIKGAAAQRDVAEIR